MPSSIIRGCTVITEPANRRHWRQIDDGAVLQRDGVIAEIDLFTRLSTRHPDVPVIGTGRQVVLPGFINSHHHIGLTPLQHGSPDMPLELWFVTRLVTRRVDLYLDTLYSAFEMIASGITTVQHLHGWLAGGLAAVEAAADEVVRAYEDIGMRVSYSFALRDQIGHPHPDVFIGTDHLIGSGFDRGEPDRQPAVQMLYGGDPGRDHFEGGIERIEVEV